MARNYEMIKVAFIYYLSINLVLFTLMFIDKLRAKKKLWRIRERVIFAFSFIGGALGGFFAMYMFRHKIKKLKFHFVFFFSFLIHTISIVTLIIKLN